MLLREIVLGARDSSLLKSTDPMLATLLRFNFEAAPIAALFERLLPVPLRSPFAKFVVDVAEETVWQSATNIRRYTPVLLIPWTVTFGNYFCANPLNRKRMCAEILRDSLTWVAAIEGWESEPFAIAYRSCEDAQFVNEWYLWKGKSVASPNKKLKARLLGRYTEKGIEVFLILTTSRQKELCRHLLLNVSSGLYGLSQDVHKLRWKDNSTLIVEGRHKNVTAQVFWPEICGD